ncbi:MAG: hypothetical protein NXI20_00070 [bacterium]|nr:hypothetical protein [bacterium]
MIHRNQKDSFTDIQLNWWKKLSQNEIYELFLIRDLTMSEECYLYKVNQSAIIGMLQSFDFANSAPLMIAFPDVFDGLEFFHISSKIFDSELGRLKYYGRSHSLNNVIITVFDEKFQAVIISDLGVTKINSVFSAQSVYLVSKNVDDKLSQ